MACGEGEQELAQTRVHLAKFLYGYVCCEGKMLKRLRFDIAFNVALLEVWFGLAVPKKGNNEKQLIHHRKLIYTFHCLPVG